MGIPLRVPQVPPGIHLEIRLGIARILLRAPSEILPRILVTVLPGFFFWKFWSISGGSSLKVFLGIPLGVPPRFFLRFLWHLREFSPRIPLGILLTILSRSSPGNCWSFL